jgi:8-oxo-dGTP diphosphatase
MAYTSEHPPFAVTVDAVVLTIRADDLQALVVTRGAEPFKGRLALPGGFVDADEDLCPAMVRELSEETGLDLEPTQLEQLAAYGAPDRDPRMRTVSIAHLALLPALPEPVGGDDATDAAWQPASWLLADRDRVAFDHRDILRDGVERARTKLESTPVATTFCPPAFTLAELRGVYEVVWGVALDPDHFNRAVIGIPGFVEPTSERAARGLDSAGKYYRRGGADGLHPALTRRSLG